MFKPSSIIKHASFDIHGGIHPTEHKSLSNQSEIKWFPVSEGSVLANESTDPSNSQFEPIPEWFTHDRQQLLERVHQAEILGMGGAAFPTDIKLRLSIDKVHTLLVNAMECEPYITCDDRLLREHAKEVLQGALIATRIVDADHIKFGIEDNKPEAIDALKKQILSYIDKSTAERPTIKIPKIEIIVSPTKYPSGGEKQLIQILTGQQVPQNQYPASLGLLVQNVATLFAINQAMVQGKSLTHRLVTLTGDLIDQPGNYWIALGTPISDIISSLVVDRENLEDIIFGGPLMGMKSDDYSLVVKKSTNCLIFNSSNSSPANTNRIMPCIRCGDCQQVCPVSLLPQQLYWYAKSEQWQQVERQNLADCIECGACSYVCPSNIELVDYFKYAKAEVNYLAEKQKKSEQAKQRFDNREKRLERIKTERAIKHEKTAEARKLAAGKKQQDPEGKKSAIEAALLRVKQKKENKN